MTHRMPYRYRDDDVGRVIAACGDVLGGGVTARFDRGVLEIRCGWRLARIAWWIVAAIAIGAAVGLAATIALVLAHDRFPTSLELVAALAPGALVALVGVSLGRPRTFRIEGAAGTIRSQNVLVGAEDGLFLTRAQDDGDRFEVSLGARRASPMIAVRGIRAGEAARMKALAIAIAAWLSAPLVETTTSGALEALRDADARLGLATPRARDASDAKERAPALANLELAVDVAIFAVRLLEAI